jgi:hypothetical protein
VHLQQPDTEDIEELNDEKIQNRDIDRVLKIKPMMKR